MQLWAHINLWEYHHPDVNNFFDGMDIDPRIDREVLLEAMLFEIGELEIVDHNGIMLRRHFEIFFRKWAIPIKELMDTAEYNYDPMVNFDYQVERNLGRNVIRDLGQDIVRKLTQALKENMVGKTIADEDTTKKSDRSQSDVFSGTVANTHNDTDEYDETTHEDTTVRHYVSAYNQLTPENADTYSDRDVTVADGTKHSTNDNQGAFNTKTDNTDTITDNISESGTKDTTTDRTEDTTKDRTDDETTKTTEDETTNTKEDEGTHKVGIDRITHQELVESQRKVVQFCLINWIIDHIAKEFVVGVW